MDKIILDFINAHGELIDKNEWEKIYKQAASKLKRQQVVEFTTVLLDADIHPENYLSEIPRDFLCNSDITTFEIPDNVIGIGNHAFEYCRGLTSIMIPDSVTAIGFYAFFDCSSLTNITYEGTKEQWKNIDKSSSSFDNVPTSIVHCSDGSLYLMAI